jgi:hypothetical protein
MQLVEHHRKGGALDGYLPQRNSCIVGINVMLSTIYRCRILRNGLVHTSYHQQMAGNQ